MVPRSTVTIHGHDLSVLSAGEAGPDDPAGGSDRPTILLIHGMAGSADTWREVIEPLSRHYRVIAPDLLGHGRSAKPRHDYSLGSFASMLRDLLATLGVDRATIVGQSLGGGVAMQFAYQYPERCERLILVNSGGLGREVSPVLRALALPGSEYTLPLLFPPFAASAGNAVSRWLYDRGIRAPSIAEQWRGYVSLTRGDNRHSFVHTLRAVVDHGGQTVSALDRLYLAEHVPTLIIWGERDRIIPVSHAHDAHAAISGSELVIFDECGHFPHTEQPGRFVDTVVHFIQSTDPAPVDAAAWTDRLTTGRAGEDSAIPPTTRGTDPRLV